jgi:hypothetical protein
MLMKLAWRRVVRTEIRPRSKDKVSVTAEMVRAEMSETVASLARSGERFKTLYWRLANAFDLTPGQIKRLHQREWKQIPAHVADTIRARAAAEKRDAIFKERATIAHLYQQIQALESRMAVSDVDFHQPQIDAMGGQMHGPRDESGGRD